MGWLRALLAFSLEDEVVGAAGAFEACFIRILAKEWSGRLSCNPSTGVSHGGLLYRRSRCVYGFTKSVLKILDQAARWVAEAFLRWARH